MSLNNIKKSRYLSLFTAVVVLASSSLACGPAVEDFEEDITISQEALTLPTHPLEGARITNPCGTNPSLESPVTLHYVHYRQDLGDVSRWYSNPIPVSRSIYTLAGPTSCDNTGHLIPRPPSVHDKTLPDGKKRYLMGTFPYPQIPNESQRAMGWFASRSNWSSAN